MAKTAFQKQVAFTTSIPVEIILAAGRIPVDLNNRFIMSQHPSSLVTGVEEIGMPRTLCAWVKGIYGWCLENPELDSVVGVTMGDCSNTHALMELLLDADFNTLSFAYPHGRVKDQLKAELEKLAEHLGTSLKESEKVRRELVLLRQDLDLVDRLTWQEGKVSGKENLIWLLESSDFNGDPQKYHRLLSAFLRKAGERKPWSGKVRLGVLGVPPIMSDLHEVLEELGGRVVFNEVPRQFAMTQNLGQGGGLLEQYLSFTYPYDVFGRADDIANQAKLRNLDGLVHYTQSFCYRGVQDIILRRRLDIPMLTIEGDRPGAVDRRTRMRLEAFIDVLR